MQTVWKKILELGEIKELNEVSLPLGSIIISVAEQNQKLAIYYKTDSEETRESVHKICVVGTGHEMKALPEEESYGIIGTVMFYPGLVLHVFEICGP